MPKTAISIVTPTFRRPTEVRELLENLTAQSIIPTEVILVDGSSRGENATAQVVKRIGIDLPFKLLYLRHGGGTAIQRNVGIEAASGDYLAFIDDDVRLEPEFLQTIIAVFSNDSEKKIGGIVGYRTNSHFDQNESERWRWYRRLKLLTVFEPGRYDFECGYPINNNMQPPFSGTRQVDFMTTACAVWRKEVFDAGHRFDPFFRDYGVLEDAHFSLRAGRAWTLLQSGDAHCKELSSPNGRVDRRKIGYKCVVNYYFVFKEIVNPLSLSHKIRFWRYQAFECFRIAASAIRRRNWNDVMDLRGRVDGFLQVLFRSRSV
jgi:glycosyltransferase involved in cell wall biosynthesis